MKKVALTIELDTSIMSEESFEKWILSTNCRIFEETCSIFSNEDSHYVGHYHRYEEEKTEHGNDCGCSDWCGTFR